ALRCSARGFRSRRRSARGQCRRLFERSLVAQSSWKRTARSGGSTALVGRGQLSRLFACGCAAHVLGNSARLFGAERLGEVGFEEAAFAREGREGSVQGALLAGWGRVTEACVDFADGATRFMAAKGIGPGRGALDQAH